MVPGPSHANVAAYVAAQTSRKTTHNVFMLSGSFYEDVHMVG